MFESIKRLYHQTNGVKARKGAQSTVTDYFKSYTNILGLICISICQTSQVWPVLSRLQLITWLIPAPSRRIMAPLYKSLIDWLIEDPLKKGQFWELFSPVKNIRGLCCGVCSKRDHSFINNGMTAWLVQPMAMLPTDQYHYIVTREKSTSPLPDALLYLHTLSRYTNPILLLLFYYCNAA